MATSKKPAPAKTTQNLPPKKPVKGGAIIDGCRLGGVEDPDYAIGYTAATSFQIISAGKDR